MATSGQFTIGELAARPGPVEFDKSEVQGSIPARFRRQVRERGPAPAIRDRRSMLTYDELDSAANRIAHRILRDHGPGPLRIGLVYPLTIDAIAAHLGVLKAGKTCVAIDPAFPPARAAEMLAGAGVQLAICAAGLVEPTRELNSVPHVLDGATAFQSMPDQDPELEIDADTPAAITYTSGTTGSPRAIVHTHRSLLHRCWSDANYLQIAAKDRISVMSSLSFGAGLPQVFSALLNGASLHPFDLKRREFSDIYEWLWSDRITIFYPPVAAFRQFLDGCPVNERYDDCRYVIQAGEATLMRTVAAWRRHFPGSCTLLCQLAITETQVVSRFAITHDTRLQERYAPVGYADCDKHLQIVDAAGAAVGPGEIGELIVSSPYISPGDYAAGAGSLQSFAGKECGTPGIGAYSFRTRDLVSQDARGRLRHHGRCDGAVKLRGYRIDFAEIEAALLEYEGIAAAVCVARELEDHRQQLVAFFVPRNPASPPASAELRRWLRSRIPDYMLPARLLAVPSLPNTINGKIARCAVASLELVQRSRGAELHTFENELQRRFVEIWRKVIGHDDIGIDDDFFDIGGDSLSLVQASAAISQCIGRTVAASAIVESQTIRRLVDILDRADDPITCVSLLPGAPLRTGRRPLFCIYGLYLYRPLAEALGPLWPTFGVHVEAETHLLRTCSASGRAAGQPAGSWPPSVEQLAGAYIDQIRKHQRTGPYQLLGASFGGVVAFEMARQLRAAGEHVAFLGMLDSFAPGARRPVTPRGWLSRAASWARNSIPLSLPDTRADRETLENNRMRAREIALDRYDPSAYEGNAVLFTARNKLELPGVTVAPNLGWSGLLSGQLSVHEIPGDHLGILKPPNVDALAASLRPFLDARAFVPSPLN